MKFVHCLKTHNLIFFFLSFLLVGCLGNDPMVGDRVPIIYDEFVVSDSNAGTKIITTKPVELGVWEQVGGNIENIQINHSFSNNPKLFWKNNFLSSRILSSPVVSKDSIFVLSESGTLAAVSKAGYLRWSFSVVPESEKGSALFSGGISLNKDLLLVSTSFGELIALSAITGEFKWRYAFGASFNMPPTIGKDSIFIISSNGLALSLNFDGKVIWSFNGISSESVFVNQGNPSIVGDIVLLPFSSGILKAVNKNTGKPVWEIAFTHSKMGQAKSALTGFSGKVVFSDNVLYFSSHSGETIASDLKGNVIWKVLLSGEGAPLVVGNNMYVVINGDTLVRLNSKTGQVVWSRKISSAKAPILYFGPILAESKLWFFGQDRFMKALRLSDGKIEYSLNLQTQPSVEPVFSSKIMYIATEEGELLAYK